MAASPLLPRVELIETRRIRFHERPERRRTLRLVERLRSDAFLRNPPIVAEMGEGQLLLLDGANRVSAFRELAIAMIPSQVVDYGDGSVELRGWHHLLLDPSQLDLRRAFSAVDGVALRPVQSREIGALLAFREVYAIWVDATGAPCGIFPAQGTPGLAERMRVLTALIACYEGESPLERIKLADYDGLPEVVRNRAHELCLFPALTKEELLNLVRAGELIPTGITRHLIPGRVLGLNVALDFIGALDSDEARHAHFRSHLEALEVGGRIRYYEEPVFVMNE